MNPLLLVETLPVIDRLSRTAPLGLRFWDEVTGRVVGDGLKVTAYPPASPLRRVEAVVNRSGVWVLTGLPGLAAVERGSGDDAFWAAPPATATFVVEVVDAWRRFVPFQMTIEAPVRGVVTSLDTASDSPPASSPGLPLYSTSSRSVPAATAVLRAELREWVADGDHERAPASWAVLEASVDGRLIARGIADERGSVALVFPYPSPVTHPLGSPPPASPPGAEGPALRDQQWEIALTARFDRLSPAPPFPGAPVLPDLADVLEQPLATIWADTERANPLGDVTLSYGQELVVRSIESAGHRERSVLFISAVG